MRRLKPTLMPSDDDLAFDLASAMRKSRPKHKRCNKHPLPPRPDTPSLLANPLPSTVRSPTQAIGDHYETRAARLLAGSGCVILGRQLRCRFGEIDLAVRDGRTLVFVEVRSSQTLRFGGAAASVGRLKQQRLILAARWWMRSLIQAHFEGVAAPCRFDLIAFESDTPVWIRDAFGVT